MARLQRGAYLESAIDALSAQTYRDVELVVVDNASTDGTEAVCRSRAERDPRVRYYRNAENLGAMKNFRCVFDLAVTGRTSRSLRALRPAR